ncbi:aminopeptidase of the M17 family [Pseudoloma neurophilia]|uniref:Aminopeptidase of the M17 family n=1 Tax=Pseudoloma neurophilia TaxID=146866 RepID=A0A0R0LXB6_9MICR|nr:aminopeptidase of the M17 family [Pseudoloma neurophilia]
MVKTPPERVQVPWQSVIPKITTDGTIHKLDFFKKKDENIELLSGENIELSTDESFLVKDDNVLIKVDSFDYECIRDATAESLSKMQSYKITRLNVSDYKAPFENFKDAVADGLILSQFKYDHFKKKEKPDPSYISLIDHDYFRPIAQNIARFLTVTPANLMTPTKFAQNVEEIIKHFDLPIKYECYDEKQCHDLKMNLFLSVGQGSVEECKFLILSYHGRNQDQDDQKRVKTEKFQSSYDFANGCSPSDKTEYDLILVGKGVTFDSGGLSLKPPKSQIDMKGDMMGASTVFSTILTVAKEKVPMNLKVFMPLTENLPSGCATKPSDVYVGRKGISVEINNTDAEGRLILADALSCAEDFNAKCILSCATLTGAVIIALGNLFYGIYSTDDEIYNKIEKSGVRVADKGWRMPLDKKYVKLLESDVADLSNVAYVAGSVTAAVFLKEFVTKYPYVHLDIAGMLETKDPWGKKFCCRPVAMLFEFCKSLSE